MRTWPLGSTWEITNSPSMREVNSTLQLGCLQKVREAMLFFSSEIMRIPIRKYYIQFNIVHFRKRRVFAINIENMNLYVKQVLKQKCPYWTNIIMLWRSRCCMLIILLLLWYKCIVLHDFSPSETTRGHQPEGSRHVELCCTAVGTWNQRGAARRVVSHGDWNESKYWVIRGVGNILKPLIFEKKKIFLSCVKYIFQALSICRNKNKTYYQH